MPEAEGTGDRRYLVVTLGATDYALDAVVVRELLRPPGLTRVPGAPAALAGLANLRGSALPVLDLRRLVRPDLEPMREATRVVVAEAGEPVGLLVDRVVGFSGGTESVAAEGSTQVRGLLTAAGAEEARILDLRVLVAEAFPRRRAVASAQGGARTARDVAAAVEPDRVALVTFTAAGRSYALPLERVAEVLALPADIVPVPRAGPAALGVVALRGGVLPLLSLPALLGLATSPPTAEARIVVARLGGTEAGLVVDALGPILRIAPEAVEPVPSALSRNGTTALDAVCRADGADRLVAVLSADRLLEGTTVTVLPARASDARISGAAEAGSDAAGVQVVVFDVAGESYGVPVGAVREVLRVPETMTRLPRAPDLVVGAIDVRGTVLAVIDQRRRFGLPPGEAGSRRRIVVIEAGGSVAGLLVDGVSRMLRLDKEAIGQTPDFSGDPAHAVDRVATLDDGSLLPILDAGTLLAGTERAVRAAAKRPAGREAGTGSAA